ncbi:hypothetical protein Tco_0350487 [Tanacetum coccineum]
MEEESTENAVKGRVTQAVKDDKSEANEMLVDDKQLQKELTYNMQKYETLKAKSTAAEAVGKGKGVSENHLNTSSKVSSAMAGSATPTLNAMNVPKLKSASGYKGNKSVVVLEGLR